MKLLLLVLLTTTQLNAAVVTCGKAKASSKTLYPINDQAIQIAANLGVKTCNRSERFIDAVKEGKHTIKVVQVTKEQIKEARKKIQLSNVGGFTWK